MSVEDTFTKEDLEKLGLHFTGIYGGLDTGLHIYSNEKSHMNIGGNKDCTTIWLMEELEKDKRYKVYLKVPDEKEKTNS